MSVGHGVNLLLNITPDDHGEIPPAQVRRLKEFGDEIAARFAKPLFTTKGKGNSLSIDFGGEKSVDHIIVREDIRMGEHVRRFTVEGRLPNEGWITLVRGTQIGNRQIVPFRRTAVTAIRLNVQESVAPAAIREFSVFNVNRAVPPLAYR